MNTNPDKPQKTKQDKNTNWLRNFAIGLLLFISGLLSKFYPATVLSVTYIVVGVILALIGISDGVAALKYKETGSDWKLVLSMGAISIVAAIYFIPAVIYLYSVNTSIYVFSAWLILRGILNIAGVIRKTLKRKNVLLWALAMIATGIFFTVFCEQIVSYAVSYLAYILLAAGVLLSFFGIYQKTDEKETKEKKLREEQIQKGLDDAVNNAKTTPGYLSAPEEKTVSAPVQTSEQLNPEAVETHPAEPADNTPDTHEVASETEDGEVVEVEAVEMEKPDETKKKGFLSSLFGKRTE
ncbi:MAG: DUF308 domain-containing protein [Eubacteriaceae bacterium]|nr:DUF308 domain-containing protein [Eubacteriaceae bacterium]